VAAALALAPEPRALAALAAAVTDEDAEVRRSVVLALGKLEDEARVAPLLAALRDADAGVQANALQGLKNVTDEQMQPALLPLLKSADPGVRGRAATMLHTLGWRPDGREEEIAFFVARGQLTKAAMHGAAALESLEAVLRNGAYTQRVAAVEALGRINDPRAMKSLLGALKSEDPAVCAAAVGALAALGEASAYDLILPLVRHADGHVRASAADAMARLGAARAVEPLLPLLKDASWDVRRATASALGRLKDARALGPLTQVLRDADADVRETVASALGNLRDRRAIGPLIKALADSSSGVRRMVTAALARLDENWSLSAEAQGAVEELKSELQSGDAELRYTVEKLLSNLGVGPVGGALVVPVEAQASLTEKRRKLALNLLLTTVRDADDALRLAAVEALARIGDRRAEPALQAAQRDAEAQIRQAAGAALLALPARPNTH
jgi:HEAT repeat protein